jgi:hypothetical protein
MAHTRKRTVASILLLASCPLSPFFRSSRESYACQLSLFLCPSPAASLRRQHPPVVSNIFAPTCATAFINSIVLVPYSHPILCRSSLLLDTSRPPYPTSRAPQFSVTTCAPTFKPPLSNATPAPTTITYNIPWR